MRFDRIALTNFKPYADVELDLAAGVTVVHGVNGSGKSSLLEAAFFALYGAAALPGTREDVITRGEEETEVTLWFTHDGSDYRIERRLKDYGDRVRHDCTLETPETTIEGATDVGAFVTDLLRMDVDAFVNCAYVRQGEVNKLIDATPTERQDMIDDLLQLGKLETYRERAGEARLGVEDVLTGKRELLDDKAARIEEIEETEPHEELNALRSDLAEVEAEIDRFEENRGRAEESLAEAERVLSEHAARRERLEEVEAEIEGLGTAVREDEAEREELLERAREADERVAELEDRIADLLDGMDVESDDPDAVRARKTELVEEREGLVERIGALGGEVERLGGEVADLEEEAAALRERAETKREEGGELEREAERGEREAVSDLPADGIEEALANAREAFADASVEPGGAEAHRESVERDLESARGERNDVGERLATARSRLQEAEDLLAEGRCPECGQDVDGSPHVESIDDYRETVADLEDDLAAAEATVERHEERLEAAESLVAAEGRIETLEARRETVETKRRAATERRDEAGELEREAERTLERAESIREEADAKRAELGECNARKGAIAEAVETLDDLADALDDREEAAETAERLRERRDELAAHNDERRERLDRLRTERDDLREAVDEERIEEAREARRKAEDYLERVTEKLADLDDRRGELQAGIGAVEERIDEYDRLRAERDDLRERVEALESLRDETVDLEAMYGDLRAELRRRNVETLERMLNETFDLVYANDAYAHIRLDDDYEIRMVQKDGETLAPEQLSGGERALFNLSLRCAIYRLLAEGIEGAAPMPPLILDEPTVFLDAGHVGRLVDLVEAMRSLGVRQTVIVSHDEELVGAADELVTVEKDPTTNRSTARRETVPGVAGDVVEADD